MRPLAKQAASDETVTAEFTAACPNCKSIVAVDLTPADVTPSKFIPAQFVPATYQPETIKPAAVTGLRLVAPPPGPVLVPSPATLKLTGNPARKFDTRTAPLAAGTVVDATGAEWRGREHNPNNWYGKGQGTWRGGRVLFTDDPLVTPWSEYHSMAGLHVGVVEARVEGLRVHGGGDGVRFMYEGLRYFELVGSWFSQLHDDAVENDLYKDGLVEDCLFDGVYVPFSGRPAKKVYQNIDGSKVTYTIRKTLARCAAFPLTAKLPNGSAGFFKIENREPARNMNWVLEDLILRADQAPGDGTPDLNQHDKMTAKNCVIVWLGPGDYPAKLPKGWTMVKDVSVWDEAVVDWRGRHPALAA